jgi:hypothetical protein
MAWVLNPNRSKVEFLSLHCDKVSSALLYRSSSWTRTSDTLINSQVL